MEALDACFDRKTGEPVRPGQLKTYREVLGQYHLQPEAKFANGDYLEQIRLILVHIRMR
jgi:hypothetical protein